MRRYRAFNEWLAVKVSDAVGTMECAYLFCCLAIYGGTAVKWTDPFQVSQWTSQTFFQLVLLPVIIVAQNVVARRQMAEFKEMHDAVLQELTLATEERDLAAQERDALLGLAATTKEFESWVREKLGGA